MDNKKFEQLIDMIINENDEQARALFHDIVVEKSREIYESMMDDDQQLHENMGGQVGGLLDEIGADERGMSEEDDEYADIEVSDDDGFGDEEGEEEFGDEEGEEDYSDDEEDEEESLEESVQLQAVKGLYGSKIGGDDGANSKSVSLTKPKVVATGAKPVNFSGESSTGGTQGGLLKPNPNTIPGSYKNAPGSKGAKTEAAPKAHTAQATGTNVKSPVAESRTAKKRLK